MVYLNFYDLSLVVGFEIVHCGTFLGQLIGSLVAQRSIVGLDVVLGEKTRLIEKTKLIENPYPTHLISIESSLYRRSSSRKSVSFFTGSPLASFHPLAFQPLTHIVMELITKWESVFMQSRFIPCSLANWIAFMDAWISPELFVGLPRTGSPTFLKNN